MAQFANGWQVLSTPDIFTSSSFQSALKRHAQRIIEVILVVKHDTKSTEQLQ